MEFVGLAKLGFVNSPVGIISPCYMSGTKLTQSDLREVLCYKCKKTGHIKNFVL